jgi:CRP-like cAMP-binding protein
LVTFLQYNRKLKSLRSDDLAGIAETVECVKHRAGAVVFIQGEEPLHAFLVLKGAVDIFIKHAEESGSGIGSGAMEDERMLVFEEEEEEERVPQLPKRSFVSYAKAVEFYGG